MKKIKNENNKHDLGTPTVQLHTQPTVGEPVGELAGEAAGEISRVQGSLDPRREIDDTSGTSTAEDGAR